MPEAAAAAPATTTAANTTPAPNTVPPTPQNGVGGAPAAAPEEFFEVTVDGQQQKYSKAEAAKLLSKAGYADKLIRQQAEERKKAAADAKKREEEEAAEAEKWRANPDAALEEYLKKRGLDADEIAKRRLEAKLKQAEMSPEAREAERAKAEAAELKKQLEKRQQEDEERTVSQHAEQIQGLMVKELETAAKAAEFPASEEAFDALYHVVADWHELGLPWNAARIVELAGERLEASFSHFRSKVQKGLPDEQLMKLLGDDIIRRASNYRINQYRKSKTVSATPAPQAGTQSTTNGQAKTQYLSPREADARLRALREKVKG